MLLHFSKHKIEKITFWFWFFGGHCLEGAVKPNIKFIDWEDHNRQPKKFFLKSEFRFETTTKHPPSPLLPLPKHGNVGVLVKILTRE